MKKLFLFFTLISYFAKSQDTLFSQRLSEVTIKSVSKKSTELVMVNTIKNLPTIADGLSIDYIKKTPDRNVSDALKRVNGVTIQNDKFVLVRGLADRYNFGWINKTPIPSTEPDRRAFSFDIIPTSLIDNIIVLKSSSANLPGDWSGGLIQINTKDISENYINGSIGIGLGTISSIKQFKLVDRVNFPNSFPSTYTFRISSNGDKRLFTKQMSDNQYKNFYSVPNFNGSINWAYKYNNISTILSGTIRNSYNINYIDRKDYQSSTELAYKYKDTSFTKRLLVNGMLNVNYLGKNRYSIKTIMSYQKENSFLVRAGKNFDNLQDVLSNSPNNINNFLINSQFDGKIKTIDFNLGYNFMFREQPDYRVNPITKSLGINEPYAIAWRDTYRFWSVMDENSFNGNINKKLGAVKLGGAYTKKLRNFQARVFRYTNFDMLDEITNNTDRYQADFDLASGYAMYDGDFGDWKINTGLRTEYNLFKVNTFDFSGQKVNVNREYLDFLPSLNLSKTVDKIKYRFSISKTLARPEFREVANFAYYDFVRNAQILGNSNLEKTDIYNLDLKWEYYPKQGENVSVAAFYKDFQKPIEQIVADGSVPSNLLLTFQNPKSASLYGIEIEVRKKLLEWLDFYANTSLMKSSVAVNGVERQLQGQSNYVINGGLNFHKEKNTFNITYNRVGDRISAVGFQGYADIFENSRDVIDIVYLRKLKGGEIKLAVGDILAQPTILYQKTRGDLIKTNNEQNISLTLNFNL